MDANNVAQFNKVTVIRPALDSGRFLRKDPQHMTEAVQEFWGRNDMGEQVKMSSNPYNLQRFDGTIQKKGPKFNYLKGRWTIIDPQDPTKTKELTSNSKFLNQMVEHCKLINDVPNHPQNGQYITSCDITDKSDPFFINEKCKLRLNVGEAIIPTDTNDTLNRLIILCLMTLKEFQVGNKKKRGRGRGRVRYVIVDKTVDRREKRKERELDAKAREILDNLTDEMKLKGAIALGVIRNIDVDKGLIDDLVWEYATDKLTKVKGGITKQQDFVQLFTSGVDTVEASFAFHRGKAEGIIRMQNKEYTAFGEKLGKTIRESIEYMTRETNDMYERISNAVASLDANKVPVTPVTNTVQTDNTTGEEGENNETQ